MDEKRLVDKILPRKPWYKNLYFKDWRDTFLFFFVLFMAFAYWHDTSAMREVYANPCNYCPRVYVEVPQYAIGGDDSWNMPSVNGTTTPPIDYGAKG